MKAKVMQKLRYIFTKDFLNDLFRKILLISIVCILIIIFSIFIYTFSVSTTSIVIGGSSSVNEVMSNLTEFYNKENSSGFTYNSSGSAAALNGIRNQSIAIGFLSKQVDENTKKHWSTENIDNFQFANEYILLIYHLPKDAQQTSELNFSTDKNQNIYHKDLLQKMYKEQIDWSQVEGIKLNNNSKHKIVGISRETGSGTRDYFDSEIIKSKEILYEQVVKSNGAMLSKIKQIPNSIGYISFSYLEQVLKQGIKIAKVDGELPYKEEKGKYIFNSKYKFKRPFTGILKKNNKKYLTLLKLIGWILSGTKDSKAIMIKDGLEPLDYKYSITSKETKWNEKLWNDFVIKFPDLATKYLEP